MRVAIILCCVFVLGQCGTMKMKKSNFPSDFVDMVKGYGYPVESFDVQTEDGYILDMFRISQGRQINSQEDSGPGNQYSPSSGREQEKKRVVFFMHGLMTNAESFIYGGPTQSIALKLADTGYDVFLGNARGTVYGQRHTTLDPKKDAAFWRFSFHEMGTKDLPALMNKALSVSGQKKLIHIGHNEGTTSFYVLLSEMPEMKNKIERHLSLGPIAFMRNSTNEILRMVDDHINENSFIMKNVGANSFTPTDELTHDAESNCLRTAEEKMCKNVYFLFNGYNSKSLNQTTVNQFASRVPSTASVRDILHFAQLKKTGRFETYTENLKTEGKKYDLSKVDIPVALFYTPNDMLSSVSDIQTLKQELPKVYQLVLKNDMDNNLDLLYSENMDRFMEKFKQVLQQRIEM